MSNINTDAELNALKHKVAELEQELVHKQAELDDCLHYKQKLQQEMKQKLQQEPKQVQEAHQPLTEAEQLIQQNQQNEWYSHFKLCEANWSDIPEGHFKGQKISAFKMLNTPVTFEMFDIFCATKHQQPPGDEDWGRENRPVINVNHLQASEYARWLSRQTGWNCHLPTEEQWEYACRAGAGTDFWYGDTPDPRMMVMGTGKTMPTPGNRMANPWDLYDMHGNVWEWTSSQKHDDFILCGGSWYNKANWLTCTSRNIAYPTACNNNWGFRLIRSN